MSQVFTLYLFFTKLWIKNIVIHYCWLKWNFYLNSSPCETLRGNLMCISLEAEPNAALMQPAATEYYCFCCLLSINKNSVDRLDVNVLRHEIWVLRLQVSMFSSCLGSVWWNLCRKLKQAALVCVPLCPSAHLKLCHSCHQTQRNTGMYSQCWGCGNTLNFPVGFAHFL